MAIKILGYVIAFSGIMILFLNGKPNQWGKNKGDMSVWKHILIDIGASLLMVLGLSLLKKI